MAANFNSKEGFFFISTEKLHEQDEAILSCIFDQNTDYDENDIKLEMIETDLYTRTSFIKTFLFPYEYVLTIVFMGKKYANNKWNLQKDYWKFLTGRMKLKELKEKL